MNDGKLEKGDVLRVAANVIIAFVVHELPIGSLFFALPLLMLDKRYPKKITDTACVAALVLVLGRNILYNLDILNQSLTWVFIMVNMFIPLSLVLCAVVWVNKDDAESIFLRMVYSFIPAVILFAVYGIFFAVFSEQAGIVGAAYTEMISAMLAPLFSAAGIDTGVLAYLVMLTILSLLLPFLFMNHFGIVYIYEAASHPESGEFEKRVMNFRIPEFFIYIFLSLWALVLLFYFVAVPQWISIPVLGLAVVSMLFYFVQGFAIADYNIRIRKPGMTSFRLASWLLLVIIIFQVVNLILVLGLSLAGVLENWVNLRKRKEFSDEDYS